MLKNLKVDLTPCDVLLVALALEDRMVRSQILIERDKCNPSVHLMLEKDLNKYRAINFKIYEALERLAEIKI